jgi:hypothetical protein
VQTPTREVLDYLDHCRSELEQAVAAIPERLRSRRPAEDAWAVGEILEHLNLVEVRIAHLLAEEIGRARAAGLGPERDTSPVVPSMPVSRLLDRAERRVARENGRPSGRVSSEEAWRQLQSTRRALRATILGADGLALSELVLPHPFLGRLNVYQWLVFVGAHEGRHTAQVREVGTALQHP